MDPNENGTAHPAPARSWGRALRRTAIGACAASALLIPLSGTAFAEIMNPGNPFFWDCGSSREGGIHVEAYGKDIRVLFEPDGHPQEEKHYSGSISEDLIGGARGKALVFASNDGGFSPNTKVICSPTP